MRQVVWADDALRDFDAAVGYLAKTSESAATLVADRIEEAVQVLADMPIGHPGRVKGTYEKLVRRTSYIIAYALSERTITILHVIHASRDWPTESWPGMGRPPEEN